MRTVGLAAAAVALLAGCHRHHVVVADQVTGDAVRRVTVTVAGQRTTGDGEVGLDLPDDDRAVVTIHADGYQPWTSTAGALRPQPRTTVLLDPRYLTDFRLGTPVPVIERKPCPCHQPKSR